jgi:hypothetical protein
MRIVFSSGLAERSTLEPLKRGIRDRLCRTFVNAETALITELIAGQFRGQAKFGSRAHNPEMHPRPPGGMEQEGILPNPAETCSLGDKTELKAALTRIIDQSCSVSLFYQFVPDRLAHMPEMIVRIAPFSTVAG